MVLNFHERKVYLCGVGSMSPDPYFNEFVNECVMKDEHGIVGWSGNSAHWTVKPRVDLQQR